MTELQFIETALFAAAGWVLITLAVSDIFRTIRQSLSKRAFRGFERNFSTSSLCWILFAAGRAAALFPGGRFLLNKLHILAPVAQVFIWKFLFITGFAAIYVSIALASSGARDLTVIGAEFVRALNLSFAVSFHLPVRETDIIYPSILPAVSIQFYQAFLFYAFICFYFIVLRQRYKQLQPRLFLLRYELGKDYSPFYFSERLLGTYRPRNLNLILQDWQQWAETLSAVLAAHPQFIYSRQNNERCPTWLHSLSIILDTSAALISTADRPQIKNSAQNALAAARRALFHTRGVIDAFSFRENIRPETGPEAAAKQREPFWPDVIYPKEEDEPAVSAHEIDSFEAWRFTYQPAVRSLSDHLGLQLPSSEQSKRCIFNAGS